MPEHNRGGDLSGLPEGDDPHSFRFIAAPSDLEPYLNSLYVWRSEPAELDDYLPAYSGQMTAFVQGSGRMTFDDGEVGETCDAFFLAPLCEAREFKVSGPAQMFGVSLNFRGWAALSGLPVNEHHDRFLAPEMVLGDALAEEFRGLAPRWRAGELDDSQLLDAMANIVRRGLSQLPPAHAQVIDRTLDWLSGSFRPDLEELYETLPYSRRQVQRLVAQFFGQSPVRLVRRYRAVRAATLLSLPELPEEIEADIREAFYDQAHLIKEIRFFTGRTPRRLLPAAHSPITDMLGPEGYGSVDLFGGGEAQQLGRDPLPD
ncbi:helix-turn-helix transcriptional regulator [Erythrobacter mangrovi]|uniref:Helix-turn-helix domain-containing protein n=1 Tax=Erythrobacter mangrovi TaxID=2739433 RepID=A0A7D3XAH6_9SPHN|nr:helix-turn-helix domain-containing protein [Erythrobacter mangrovi]QKG70870.1 helix-turn-helix domain-containing protein [Erythrobacter mangrovi]